MACHLILVNLFIINGSLINKRVSLRDRFTSVKSRWAGISNAHKCVYSRLKGQEQNKYQFHQLLEKRNQLQKLVVISVHKPALDRDPVGELEKDAKIQQCDKKYQLTFYIFCKRKTT